MDQMALRAGQIAMLDASGGTSTYIKRVASQSGGSSNASADCRMSQIFKCAIAIITLLPTSRK